MENASKALLIAGGVLIAIIILSIALFLYSLYANRAKEYSQIMSTTELQKFNSKFETYVGRNDITAQEIVSVVNLAKEYNGQVKIYLGITQLVFSTEKTPEDFIKENQDKMFAFRQSTASQPNPEYDSNGRIKKIIFIEKI